MKLTNCKVFKDGKLLSTIADVEVPNFTMEYDVTQLQELINKSLVDTCTFNTIDGGDIRKGAIDI